MCPPSSTADHLQLPNWSKDTQKANQDGPSDFCFPPTHLKVVIWMIWVCLKVDLKPQSVQSHLKNLEKGSFTSSRIVPHSLRISKPGPGLSPACHRVLNKCWLLCLRIPVRWAKRCLKMGVPAGWYFRCRFHSKHWRYWSWGMPPNVCQYILDDSKTAKVVRQIQAAWVSNGWSGREDWPGTMASKHRTSTPIGMAPVLLELPHVYTQKLCHGSSPIMTQSCKHGKADRTHTNTLNNKPQKQLKEDRPYRSGMASCPRAVRK